jgi:ABC-type branched-subunit amino acid transport system substrate-binding protein
MLRVSSRKGPWEGPLNPPRDGTRERSSHAPTRLLNLSLLLVTACASVSAGQAAPATPVQPPPFDAAAPADAAHPANVTTSDTGVATLGADAGDRGAEADFSVARAKFDRGDRDGARAALEAFVARHPTDAERPLADLMLGRLALARGDAAAAKQLFAAQAVATGPADAAASARYFLGFAELRLGNFARARELLSPFVAKGAPPPAPTDDAAIELRGALAEATGPGDPVEALDLWDAYFRAARDAERAWARRRASELAGKVAPEAAWRAWGAAAPGGLARAVLGGKAAAHLREKGDPAGAAFVESETSAARHALGFDASGSPVGPGDPTRVGLALPLSGKFQVVGEAALRAAMLAASAPAGGVAGNAGTTQLVVRDTATDAERAARGVAELTRGEAVIGIVGAASGKAGPAAIAQASEDGIAVLSLEDAAPGALTTAFQMIHAPDMRAAALARQALKLGARRFAILGPDSAMGKRLREAFRKAVTDGAGTVVAEATYVAGATSFAGPIGALKKAPFDAIFVPDSADRLPLIAPALAVADLWPQPWASRAPLAAPPKAARGPAKAAAPAKPRPVLLMSTASDVSHKLLETAGRYVQGALLCPGFFADDSEPRSRAFVEGYRAAYGRDPHATEAYAYDAVVTLQTAVRQGARTRGDVVKALGTANTPVLHGLTGNVTFGPDHGRIDSPLVYVVDGNDIHAVK